MSDGIVGFPCTNPDPACFCKMTERERSMIMQIRQCIRASVVADPVPAKPRSRVASTLSPRTLASACQLISRIRNSRCASGSCYSEDYDVAACHWERYACGPKFPTDPIKTYVSMGDFC